MLLEAPFSVLDLDRYLTIREQIIFFWLWSTKMTFGVVKSLPSVEGQKQLNNYDNNFTQILLSLVLKGQLRNSY